MALVLSYDGKWRNHGYDMTHPARKLGTRGESLARQYLVKKGYAIVTSNWSTPHGEIDIIARYNGIIVFVEVKTRHGRDTESALAGITPAKHERLVKAAYQYLHDHDLDEVTWRIDAIAIALDRHETPIIDHVEDVFDW